MKIFLSYASEDRSTAEAIAFSLRDRGHEVFLDRDGLRAGEGFDKSIEQAVNTSNIFIFLISPDSVAEGRYTLTELTFARQKWPSPSGHVLPVRVRTTTRDQIPSYLQAVTILEPHGNVAAETSAKVDQMGVGRNTKAETEKASAESEQSQVGSPLWAFLRERSNREVLAWIGGGVVVVVAGLWTAVYIFLPKHEVQANCGVGVVGDVNGATITVAPANSDCSTKTEVKR
jgi:stage V sporulation protein SpoVS